MPGPVRGVLFDKDGTLIDFEKTWLPGVLSAARALAAIHEIKIDADILTRAAGGDPDKPAVAPGSLLAQGTALEVAQLWCGMEPCLPDPSETAAWLDDYWLEHAARNLTPVCDLHHLFTRLRAEGVRIAIVTNDAERGAQDMLDALGLNDLVDFVAGYDSGHTPKPAPDMIEAFLRKTGLPASDTIMVGDNKADIEAGRAAGCRMTVGVLTGATPEEELIALADAVIDHAGHIPSLLFQSH